MIIDDDILNKILKIMLWKANDFAELFVEKKRWEIIVFREGIFKIPAWGSYTGVGIRLVRSDVTYYSYTNILEEESLYKVAHQISRDEDTKCAGRKSYNNSFKIKDSDFNEYSQVFEKYNNVKEKILLANEIARLYNSKITEVECSYTNVLKEIQIINSLGANVSDYRSYSSFKVTSTAKYNGVIQKGQVEYGKTGDPYFLSELDVDKITDESARKAINMLTAKEPPAGEMMVVLGNSHGGVLLHEACGHMLEADTIQKNGSIFKDMLNTTIANKEVTLIDDSNMPHGWGSTKFDDEGQPTGKNILIYKGKLNSYIHSLLSARRDNKKSTGNGRRESYKNPPLCRMTNTYLERGQSPFEDIVKSVKRGIFVKTVSGGEVKSANGNFAFGVSESYLIENGKITWPLRGVTIIGNAMNVLNSIDMIGDDLNFIISYCGKNNQIVPVSIGQPTIRIRKLLVGGMALDK